jgi:uncharacterized SAM-binding protein YcdF (DUF218 family)
MIPVGILLLLAAAAIIWLHVHRLQRNRLWWSAWAVPAAAFLAIAVLVWYDLYLQKVVGRLLMPAGLLWCLLIGISFGAAVTRHWRSAAVALLVTVLYTCAGNIWIGGALVRSLENMVKPYDVNTGAPFDAVLVLGGGTDVDATGRPQLGSYGGRITMGVRCFYAGKAPILVASGMSFTGDNRNLAEETREIWRDLGVPDTAIVMLPKARITREEIAELQTLATEKGWQRIGLISSAWHLPRALVTCGDLGFAVTPIPCDWRGRSEPWWFLYLSPHHDGFERVHIGCWEWLGRSIGR